MLHHVANRSGAVKHPDVRAERLQPGYILRLHLSRALRPTSRELSCQLRKITLKGSPAAVASADAMPRLRTMKELSEYWIEINRLENAGDKNHRRLRAHLFSGEYKAMEVLKLKDTAALFRRIKQVPPMSA